VGSADKRLIGREFVATFTVPGGLESFSSKLSPEGDGIAHNELHKYLGYAVLSKLRKPSDFNVLDEYIPTLSPTAHLSCRGSLKQLVLFKHR